MKDKNEKYKIWVYNQIKGKHELDSSAFKNQFLIEFYTWIDNTLANIWSP